MRTKTIIFYTFLLILPITIFVELHFFCNFINDIYKILIILSSVLLSILSLVFHKSQKISFYRFCFVINIIMNGVFAVLCVMDYYNLGYIFSSINNLKQFILSTKSFGMLVFVAIQISQVLLVPIPAAIITRVNSFFVSFIFIVLLLKMLHSYLFCISCCLFLCI